MIPGASDSDSHRIGLIVVLTSQPAMVSELSAADAARAAAKTAEQRPGFLASRRARALAHACAGRAERRLTSIAHTGALGVCAVALSPAPAGLVGVGVDAEPLRRADPRTARFFLDERERALLDEAADEARSSEHVRLWTTKEAMFKADPANAERVLLDYHLSRPAAKAGYGSRDRAAGNRAETEFGYINRTITGIQLTVALAVNRSAPVDHASLRGNVSAPPVTFEAVTERISAILSVPVERLTADSTLADLAADSFLLVEMVVDLQEEFDAIFTQADLRKIEKLSDLVSVLQSHAGKGWEPATEPGDGPRP